MIKKFKYNYEKDVTLTREKVQITTWLSVQHYNYQKIKKLHIIICNVLKNIK